MLHGQKILVTGVTGAIAMPVAKFLAQENQVFGAARFTNARRRLEAEEAGITICPIDLARGELDSVPTQVDFLLHYAYMRSSYGEFDSAIEVNGVGTGRMLSHCRTAKAAMVVSSGSIYSARPGEPYHAFVETDDIGQSQTPWNASAPTSKVAMEAVARFCAVEYDLPTVIVRPSAPYGTGPDVPGAALHAALMGRPYPVMSDPQPYSTVHVDDMCRQVSALLSAATVPANIVNWATGEVVTLQEIADLVEEFTGKRLVLEPHEVPGVGSGFVLDPSKCSAITGAPKLKFRAEFEKICRAAMAAQNRR